jgi:hypothetical protein
MRTPLSVAHQLRVKIRISFIERDNKKHFDRQRVAFCYEICSIWTVLEWKVIGSEILPGHFPECQFCEYLIATHALSLSQITHHSLFITFLFLGTTPSIFPCLPHFLDLFPPYLANTLSFQNAFPKFAIFAYTPAFYFDGRKPVRSIQLLRVSPILSERFC